MFITNYALEKLTLWNSMYPSPQIQVASAIWFTDLKNKFKKFNFSIGSPYYLVGWPCYLVGSPYYLIGQPCLLVGLPMVLIGTPMVLVGSPIVFVRSPCYLVGTPMVLIGIKSRYTPLKRKKIKNFTNCTYEWNLRFFKTM